MGCNARKTNKQHVYNRGGQGSPRVLEQIMMMMMFITINSNKVQEQR
jgi:hypothetical protein